MPSIPRSRLPGMQVYNPDGTFVGTVQDVALPIGEGEISLQVLARDGSVKVIEWGKVAAAGDIVILKEKVEVEVSGQAGQPAPTREIRLQPQERSPLQGVKDALSKMFSRVGGSKPACPTCGKPLTYIEQYKRWYCYNCRRYA